MKMVVFLSVAMCGALASAELILSDTFTTTATRTGGSQLDGDALEVGGVNWDVSSTKVIINGGNYIWMNPANNFIARASITNAASAQIIEFQADVRVDVSGAGTESMLGFGKSGSNATWQEGVRIRFKENGNYIVSYDGGLIDSGGLTGAQFNSGSFNTLKMTYNTSDNTLSAWVNSTQVVTDYDFDDVSFNPTLDVAGFSAINTTTGERWDNFSVTTIPEPATVGLFGLSAMFVLLMRRTLRK